MMRIWPNLQKDFPHVPLHLVLIASTKDSLMLKHQALRILGLQLRPVVEVQSQPQQESRIAELDQKESEIEGMTTLRLEAGRPVLPQLILFGKITHASKKT